MDNRAKIPQSVYAEAPEWSIHQVPDRMGPNTIKPTYLDPEENGTTDGRGTKRKFTNYIFVPEEPPKRSKSTHDSSLPKPATAALRQWAFGPFLSTLSF